MIQRICNYLERKGIHHMISLLQPHDSGVDNTWVIIADWNDPRLEKLSDLLDSQWARDRGIQIGFNDEYTFCHACGHAVYKQSLLEWNWFETKYEIICRSCAESGKYDEDILKFAVNNPCHSLPDWLVRYFMRKGVIALIQDDFESGLHSGQNDDPIKILQEYIEDYPSDKFVFGIQAISMFTTTFGIYRVMDIE
ncbi:MAG: hypothetical protein ACOCWW_01100 [Bacteroidota bacterium]